MNLLVDIGNTRAKFCRYSYSEGLSQTTALDENITLNSIFDKVIVSNVSKNNSNHLLSEIKYSHLINVSVTSEAFGIKCGYPKSKNLGIDRWMAIIAAESLYPNKNLLVVDAGTATTIDFLTADKKHLCGWIIPGLELMQSSIADKAPHVFTGELNSSEEIGTDTPSALFNGCLNSQLGLIQQAYQKFNKILNQEEIVVVITGGAANSIAEELTLTHHVNSQLLFHGLSRFC